MALEWTPPKLSDLPSWEGEKQVSIDVETCDPLLTKLGTGCRRDNSFVVGYSFAFPGNRGFYIPLRHDAGGNVDNEQAIAYLHDNAKVFTGDVVGMNLSYDIDWLAHDLGVTFPQVRFYRDIGIADPLIYELHMFYNMNAIARRHGLKGKDEEKLVQRAVELGLNPKSDLWKLHSRDVGAYGEGDATLPLQILERQQILINEKKLQKIFDMESQLLPILVKMRTRGVLIDQKQLEFVENSSLEEETRALKQVHDLIGIKINVGDVWTSAKIAPALEKIGIKLPRTKTGKPSIKKDDALNYDHPVAKALGRARVVNKLRTTFVKSIKTHMINGRIHCSFTQIAKDDQDGNTVGARYGRLSCVHPNMQQQPRRGEFASIWRKIYLPEPGTLWCCNDYSQQEPRWTTHYANIANYEGANAAAREYRDNPKADNHDMMVKLTGLLRDDAKAVFLGLCYGEGGAKLSRGLGLPTRWALNVGNFWNDKRVFYYETEEEARQQARTYQDERKYLYETAGEEGQAIIDKFNNKVPFVKRLSKDVEATAKKYGFIITAGGRHLHFAEKPDASGYDFTYRALNRLIQGSGADQTKKSMIDLDRECPEFWMQLQVHDDLNGSIKEPQVAKRVAEIMTNAITATVPFKVTCKIGPNWGEIEEL